MRKTPRIRIGNQTSFTAPVATAPFEYAVAHGFDAFEWFPDKKESGAGWSERDIPEELRLSIKETAAARDISLSVHAPWEANPLKPDASDALRRAAGFTRDIGASLLNIHLYNDKGIAAFAERIIPLAGSLSSLGIRLSIENTPLTTPEDFNQLFCYLRRNAPDTMNTVGMCLDLGHANLCIRTLNDYLGFVDLLNEEVPIIHVHLHENYGDYDSHLPFFTGPSQKDETGIRGFMKRLNKREFSGCIILEQWPQPEELLDQARGRLLEMLQDNPEQGTEVSRAESEDFAEVIARADQSHRSWRNKLSWIHDVLTKSSFPLTTDHLVYLAIYLRFIGTGAVRCSEDGGHYRPSHHARLSRKIFDRLSGLTTPENVFILRKIHPWLPSFDAAYARAEPLTRIRDIAHRNDIPHELKEEIKHTLQNKLHRSAGPEDLSTSASLLARIAGPDSPYSPMFIREFRRFHEELTDFFNAGSLDAQLNALSSKEDPVLTGLIGTFVARKNGADSLERAVGALEALTSLRAHILERFREASGAEAQRLLLADIRLDDFSFPLMSRLNNSFDSLKRALPWKSCLLSLVRGVENLRLSGIDPGECRALESEIASWSREFEPGDRTQLLRLKATVERCRRLADFYCHEVLHLFSQKALHLGRSLGIAEDVTRTYAEGDIRGHAVFQLSRLTSILSHELRISAGLPSWEVIVPGKATGLLVAGARMDGLSGYTEGPLLALLERVEGDEEIPTTVAGIIAPHETPHLSHFAIRARQGRVLFAVCYDRDHLIELKGMSGKQVSVEAIAEEVRVAAVSALGNQSETDRSHVIHNKETHLQQTHMTPRKKVFRLSETDGTGGAKAESLRRLEELSHTKGAGFNTLPCLVIPFGVMEEALRADHAVEGEYRALVNEVDQLPQTEIDTTIMKMQNLLRRIPVPGDILSAVLGTFSREDRLMVRSSANYEDLNTFSGAGLYESVPNVRTDEVNQAVRSVWGSLWTRRAVLSRKSAGIPHRDVQMAVLIQPMRVPDYSFVIHTVNPVNHNPHEVYIEAAVGMGEVMTSGKTAGSPYRLICRKGSGQVEMRAFASFSHALWPDPAGGLTPKTIDYSEIGFSKDNELRNRITGQLCEAGESAEAAFGGPQDIEGVISEETVYLVQSRPQQGLG